MNQILLVQVRLLNRLKSLPLLHCPLLCATPLEYQDSLTDRILGTLSTVI